MNIVEKPKLFALGWRAKLAEWAATFATSVSLRLVRYFIAGVGVSVGYTITVLAFMELLLWRSAVTANTVSFLLWTPVSYAVHRSFIFRFDGRYAESAIKFGATFLGKLVTSIAIVAGICDYFELHYIFAVLANWIALPLVTYIILKLWVFGGAVSTSSRLLER
jgi:putative flippase GtrA